MGHSRDKGSSAHGTYSRAVLTVEQGVSRRACRRSYAPGRDARTKVKVGLGHSRDKGVLPMDRQQRCPNCGTRGQRDLLDFFCATVRKANSVCP
jgi:hypothetical protein